MKTIVSLFIVLLISSPVFAASNDLKIMDTLLKAGATSEQFMSQIHIGLDTVECAYSNNTNAYDCNMTDLAANNEEGAELVLTGENAKAVYGLLIDAGAPSDNGMGKVFVSAAAIRCVQAIKDVADGSDADRTSCSFEFQ